MRGDKTRWITRNFNPRGPCGPRQPVGAMPVPVKLISILAVLADRDLYLICSQCAELKFQSSRSVRTATLPLEDKVLTYWEFQSSRSLRTATEIGVHSQHPEVISILAVLADRDDRRG